MVGTLTHQPDPRTDSAAYAAYADHVTTCHFLASHLVASIHGVVLGLLRTAALGTLLLAHGAGTAHLVTAVVLTVVGSVVNVAPFGVAAFAQPAVGRVWSTEPVAAVALDADVYGPDLMATAAVGLLAHMAGAVLLGSALGRAHPSLRQP